MLTVMLGDPAKQREEVFLDGKLTVISRDGLLGQERALLPLLPAGKTGRALIVNSTYGVLAHALRALNPGLEIVCVYDDAWNLDRAVATLNKFPLEGVQVLTAPDPPAGPWNYIAMPLERRGFADLVRERLRLAANEWLAPKGLLITSSDTKDDRFIRDEVKKAFGAVHIAPEERRSGAVGYTAKRPPTALVAPPRAWNKFTVPENGEILEFASRIGVFCDDRIDPGTRALLTLMRVDGHKRILDLGCGTGVVGIIAARRNPEAEVTLVDSNARAIESARRNVAAHGVAERCAIVQSADATTAFSNHPKFDVILTNPPYYGNWRIAEMFLETARQVLRKDGELQIVTKAPNWYVEQMRSGFSAVRQETRGGYTVLFATLR